MTIRRHQYRDIINKEILQLSERDINNINVLSPYTLLYLNKPLRRYTERKSDTQGQRYVLNHTIKINLGQGLLHAIVFNTVLDSIVRDKKINKLFFIPLLIKTLNLGVLYNFHPKHPVRIVSIPV